MVRALAIVVACLATSNALAQDLKSKFLNNFANAIVAAGKCKAWKVNSEMVMPVMNFLKITTDDISPGGADWPLFQQDIQQAQENVKPLDDDEICTAAAKMFGPKGLIAPNLMIPTGN
jgi:hypothetical protein